MIRLIVRTLLVGCMFSTVGLGFQAGFDVNVVGLNGEVRTSAFGVLRDGCPHKGVDYSSSQRPRDFTAGVYGKVVEPEESNYGTIAIVPFNKMGYVVQYLHTSAKYVQVGDIILPWTILGATGDTAPETNPSDGIHLHLQVQDVRATPTERCWNNRHFVDPETWQITNPLVGSWRASTSSEHQGVTIEEIAILELSGDTTGSPLVGNLFRKMEYVSPRTGTLYTVESRYVWSGRISGRQKNSIQIETFPGTCTIIFRPTKPATCTALPGLSDAQLLSADSLSTFDFGGPGTGKTMWSKLGPSAASSPPNQSGEKKVGPTYVRSSLFSSREHLIKEINGILARIQKAERRVKGSKQ